MYDVILLEVQSMNTDGEGLSSNSVKFWDWEDVFYSS